MVPFSTHQIALKKKTAISGYGKDGRYAGGEQGAVGGTSTLILCGSVNWSAF